MHPETISFLKTEFCLTIGNSVKSVSRRLANFSSRHLCNGHFSFWSTSQAALHVITFLMLQLNLFLRIFSFADILVSCFFSVINNEKVQQRTGRAAVLPSPWRCRLCQLAVEPPASSATHSFLVYLGHGWFWVIRLFCHCCEHHDGPWQTSLQIPLAASVCPANVGGLLGEAGRSEATVQEETQPREGRRGRCHLRGPKESALPGH